jgi:hypothetical protein
LTWNSRGGLLTRMRASRSEHGDAWGRGLRAVLACTIAALPVLHGHFHEGGPSAASPSAYRSVTGAPRAAPVVHDPDSCPICCLLHNGSTPPEVPVQLVEGTSVKGVVFVEQCSVVPFLPLASFPPRAPPA